MGNERARLVCMSSARQAHVASVQDACVECGALVWRSLGSLAQDVDVVCMGCVNPDIKPKVAFTQIVELANHLGVDPEEMAAQLVGMGMEIADPDDIV